MPEHQLMNPQPAIDPARVWAENDADRWVLALWAPYVEASYPTVASDPIWFEKLDGGYPPELAERCRQTLADDWDIVDKESMILEIRALLDVGHRNEYDQARALLIEGGLLGKSKATLEAARAAQARFQSWQHLAESFHWGRRWWGQATPESEDKFKSITERLLNHPNSPWQNLDWRTDLDVAHHPSLEAQAAAGGPQAQYLLATKLKHGQGRKVDDAAAFSWMLKAAENGHQRAQNEVGVMYQTGKGTAVDLDAAAHWYQAGAENGSPSAGQNLENLRRNR